LVYTIGKPMDDEYQNERDLKNEVRRLQVIVEIHMRSTEK
jgi:hypothetical protein